MNLSLEFRFRMRKGTLSGYKTTTMRLMSGTAPPGVDIAHQRVRSAALVLPPDRPFKDAEQEALVTRPGMAPVSV